MELHSYAKRRVAKKWSTEQKRKLVETRIARDALFSHKPSASLAPWKKIVSLANLDDYNVFFVRKQWSNMVAKYKQYKHSRLGNIPTKAIDDEMIQKITQEWEFFAPIHRFMTHKTTTLHSYALPTTELTKNILFNTTLKTSQPTATNSNSSNERIQLFSSDTNEEYATTQIPNESKTQNTDHDFYTKKQLSYFADVSDETQESLLDLATTNGALNGNGNVVETEREQKQKQTQSNRETTTYHNEEIKAEHETETVELPHTLAGGTNGINGAGFRATKAQSTKRSAATLSERDKYYRHKRRFNRRLERRFDSILNVFGQIVKAEYPSIDLSPLLGASGAASAAASCLFKSENEDSAEEEQSTTDAELVANSEEENANETKNREKNCNARNKT